MFWFGLVSGYSGITIYDVLLYELFNTIYTALPIIFYATLDKEYPSKVLMKHP